MYHGSQAAVTAVSAPKLKRFFPKWADMCFLARYVEPSFGFVVGVAHGDEATKPRQGGRGKMQRAAPDPERIEGRHSEQESGTARGANMGSHRLFRMRHQQGAGAVLMERWATIGARGCVGMAPKEDVYPRGRRPCVHHKQSGRRPRRTPRTIPASRYLRMAWARVVSG